MPLTEEQQRNIADTLNERTEGRVLLCPISGDSSWEVQDIFANLPGGIGPGGSENSFPSAVILCKTCGYTMLVNLIRLGIAEQFGYEPVESEDVSAK